jgi:hypothetical protein
MYCKYLTIIYTHFGHFQAGRSFQRRSHKEKRTPVEEEAFKGGVTKRTELQSKRKLSKEESQSFTVNLNKTCP